MLVSFFLYFDKANTAYIIFFRLRFFNVLKDE